MARIDRLSLFVFLWALQVLFQHTVFDNWLQDGRAFAWLQVLTACALMIRPSSLTLTLCLTLFTVLHYGELAPFFVNHHLNEILISLLLFGVICNSLLTSKGLKATNQRQLREHIFKRIVSPIRLSFVLIYWFAFLSKLNSDFLNPEVSCAVIMYNKTVLAMPFLPTGDAVYLAVIWGTLIFELLLPVFLAFRTTRQQTIFVALAFHFFLSFSGHRSFSSHAYAVLFVFFADDFAPFLHNLLNRVHKMVHRLINNPDDLYSLLRSLIIPGFIALIVAVVFSDNHPWLRSWLRRTWYVYSLLYLIIAALYLLNRPNSKRSFTTRQLLLPKMQLLCWLFPFVVFFNGINPYLGLKTHTVITMYSNLRTEGDIQNHLLIPGSFKFFDYQEDMLEILESDSPWLQGYADEAVLINRIHLFQKIRQFTLTGFVVIRYNNAVHCLDFTDGEMEQQDVLAEPTLLARKLLFFRLVDKQEPCLCRH